ncbi:hypothetical protein B5180_09435 [Streptomyces sp. BF-3]|nr:hypothetical protein B5180_09435 [Streptomyces sp. BF-3]
MTGNGAVAFTALVNTSPYLLQHAGNPVDWWPWGPEAFVEAERREVPALLSASSRPSDVQPRRPADCASGHINLPLATGTSALP